MLCRPRLSRDQVSSRGRPGDSTPSPPAVMNAGVVFLSVVGWRRFGGLFFWGIWVGQGESLVWPEESQFWLRWERDWAEAGWVALIKDVVRLGAGEGPLWGPTQRHFSARTEWQCGMGQRQFLSGAVPSKSDGGSCPNSVSLIGHGPRRRDGQVCS